MKPIHLVLALVLSTSACSYQVHTDVSASSFSGTVNSVSQVVVLPKSTPIRIRIPSISLDSKLMKLGLEADGSLQVPPKAFPAGWYIGSPTPGQVGPSIIAGHIDWNGPGVFYSLNRVRLGDQIIISRIDGTIVTFKVTRIAAFLKSAFPTNDVYGNLSYPGIRLITCGDYNFKLHNYVRDLVVFGAMI